MLKAELNSTYRDHTVSDIRNSNTDLDRIVDGEYQMQFYEMQAQLVAAQSKTRVGGHGFVDETSITQTGLYNLIKEQATQVHRVLQHTLQSGTCCNVYLSSPLYMFLMKYLNIIRLIAYIDTSFGRTRTRISHCKEFM